MRDDWRYFLDYFVMAWTLNGFEAPMMIGLLSIATFLVFVLVVDPYWRENLGKRSRGNSPSDGTSKH